MFHVTGIQSVKSKGLVFRRIFEMRVVGVATQELSLEAGLELQLAAVYKLELPHYAAHSVLLSNM